MKSCLFNNKLFGAPKKEHFKYNGLVLLKLLFIEAETQTATTVKCESRWC